MAWNNHCVEPVMLGALLFNSTCVFELYFDLKSVVNKESSGHTED